MRSSGCRHRRAPGAGARRDTRRGSAGCRHVDRGTLGHEARLLRGVAGQEQVRAAVPPGQQQTGLLEGLAHDGHPVGQPAGAHAEEGALAPWRRCDPAHSASGFGPAVEQIADPAAPGTRRRRHQTKPSERRLRRNGMSTSKERAVAAGRRRRAADEHDRGGHGRISTSTGGWNRWRHAMRVPAVPGGAPGPGGHPSSNLTQPMKRESLPAPITSPRLPLRPRKG